MKFKSRQAHAGQRVVGAFLFTLLLAAGCAPSDANEKPAPAPARPVKAMQLHADAGLRELRLPGVVRALRDSDLSFRVGGPLIDLLVDTGSHVAQGQVVARIDPRDFEIKVNTSRAELNSAQARLAEAELQFSRYAKLITHQAVAQAEYDGIKVAYQVAQAQAESAAKALENARNALADTVLKAPFAGYINERFVDNHETLQPGQAVVSLVDPSQLEVRLALSEDLLPLTKNFVSFSCTLDALPGRSFPARLKEVGKKADAASRTYPLILTLEPQTASLVRPGMSAEVAVGLTRASPRARFVVPLSALVNQGGQDTFVWVVDPQTGRLSRAPVTILRLVESGAQIRGQVQSGQWIVTGGANSLADGQTVRLVSQPSATNIGREL
ncbi:MAG: efflux RND transporter periplasmic adaptor subunit [Deltaproteobacteria bacterium]|nr:efflux RND transporter periplasmic adaptor subunit [Deltaproteobacteria bacterium]